MICEAQVTLPNTVATTICAPRRQQSRVVLQGEGWAIRTRIISYVESAQNCQSSFADNLFKTVIHICTPTVKQRLYAHGLYVTDHIKSLASRPSLVRMKGLIQTSFCHPLKFFFLILLFIIFIIYYLLFFPNFYGNARKMTIPSDQNSFYAYKFLKNSLFQTIF